MDKRTEILADNIAKLFESLGVKRYSFVFSDPDSDQVGFAYTDEMLALRGARAMQDQILTMDGPDEDPPEFDEKAPDVLPKDF